MVITPRQLCNDNKSKWGKNKGFFKEQNTGKFRVAVESWAKKAVQ